MKDSEVAGWMWAEACGLIEQAERLHRQFFRIGSPRERMLSWEPPVDVFETDGQISICVALPGVAAENIQVTIDGDVLSIAGVRLMPKQSQTALIHRLEIPHGRFERRIRLPTRYMKVVQSLFDNGCLALTLHRV
jgi:HSP20 family protein